MEKKGRQLNTKKRKQVRTNYQLDQYDYQPHEEDEGDINKFQIYDTLSK